MGVDDIGGEEDLHVARDQADRLLALPSQRGGGQSRDLGERFCAQVQREQQVALRRGQLRGHAKGLCAGGEALGLDAELVDLHLDVERRLAARAEQRREQRAGDVFVGFVGDLARAAVVVLERLRFFAFQAAIDDQDDHDQQHHADARRHAAAHHHRVLVERQRATSGAARLWTVRRGSRGTISGRLRPGCSA